MDIYIRDPQLFQTFAVLLGLTAGSIVFSIWLSR